MRSRRVTSIESHVRGSSERSQSRSSIDAVATRALNLGPFVDFPSPIVGRTTASTLTQWSRERHRHAPPVGYWPDASLW